MMSASVTRWPTIKVFCCRCFSSTISAFFTAAMAVSSFYMILGAYSQRPAINNLYTGGGTCLGVIGHVVGRNDGIKPGGDWSIHLCGEKIDPLLHKRLHIAGPLVAMPRQLSEILVTYRR